MNRHEPSGNRLLRRQLRREARLDRPAFSEALHARIMLELRRGPNGDVVKPSARKGRLAAKWLLAACASIALAAALVWRLIPGGMQPNRERPEIVEQRQRSGDEKQPFGPQIGAISAPAASDFDSAADAVTDSTDGIGEWMASTAEDNQWAGLDRDAQSALAAVAGTLPFDITDSLALSDPDR